MKAGIPAVVFAVCLFVNSCLRVSLLFSSLELGHELRCVVDVGSIHRIEITTVRREVYVDEAPVKMRIRALDKKGRERLRFASQFSYIYIVFMFACKDFLLVRLDGERNK